MKPYYQDSSVEIYHGDCREILPQISANVLVSDPVWPNTSLLEMAGADNPEKLFSEAAALIDCERAAIQIGCDTPPFFLSVLN